jgi:hypothetical protein
MTQHVLRDNILAWNILSHCLSCGILIPEALPAVEAECLNKSFVRDVFADMGERQGAIPMDWNNPLLPASAAACLEVAGFTTMWEQLLGAAGDLLLRRAFTEDPQAVVEYYYSSLLSCGIPEEQIAKILKLELNSAYHGQGESDLEALRARLPLPAVRPTPHILFYQRLQRELSAGNGLFESVASAACSEDTWNQIFSSLNSSEDEFAKSLQTAGFRLVEQLMLLQGLRGGTLNYALNHLIRSLEVIELMKEDRK